MTLLTPRNFQFTVGVSVLSRVVIILLQFVFNSILADHVSDGHKNAYYQALNRNNTADYGLTDVYRYFYYSIEGFTKWDAQYFLEIATDGYTIERHLAFLPLFPIMISITRQLIFDHTGMKIDNLLLSRKLDFVDDVITAPKLESYIRSAVVGVALNNFILFPIATLSLFTLTKVVKKCDDKYARNVVWWFCFNPASIFFSACYTESLFSCLSFTAMFVLEQRSHNYLSNHETDFTPLGHLNRLLHICLPSLALMALSSATRSNGLILIGFICYQFLLKYAPIAQLDRKRWSIMIYFSLILECIQDILVVFMSSVVAASGYITFQIYSYIKYCLRETAAKKGELHIKPAWCDNLIPHPYGYVQSKYWDVGLFRYYHLKKLPNFVLALPVTSLVLLGSLKKSRSVTRLTRDRNLLVYYIQVILLTLFCGLTINVEVTTRLLASSCPVLYWICEDTASKSRVWSRILTFYFLTYYALGTILHTNSYPWT